MYNVLFHLRMSLQYLKYAKKIPEKQKEQLYKDLEALLKKAQQLQEEWK